MKSTLRWLCLFSLLPTATFAAPKTQNIFLLTADGLRWQEVFRGAEALPLKKEFGSFGNSNSIRTNFWRPTRSERRAALCPFLWNTVAKEGQLWGNRDQGSEVRVSNGHNFSYPGYNEFLTGYPDPKIDSNDRAGHRAVRRTQPHAATPTSPGGGDHRGAGGRRLPHRLSQKRAADCRNPQ